MKWVDRSNAARKKRPTSHAKQETASCYEIAVEDFEQGQQRGCKDDADDPARSYGVFEGNRCHELLAGKVFPGGREPDSRDNNGVEEDSYDDRHGDRDEKLRALKFWAGFLGSFAHRFVSCHEIRNDLHDKQNGYQRGVREERRQVLSGTPADARCDENYEEGNSAERCPILESGAEADTSIVKQGQEGCQRKTNKQVRQVHGTPGNAVQLDGVE